MKNSIKKWLENARWTSSVQSVMPAVLTLVLAIGQENFSWWLGLLAIVGVWTAHLSLNLADDLFDYKADMLKDREKVIRKGFKAFTAKYPYLTDGSATVKDLWMAILGFAAVALVCGGVIAWMRGWEILLIAALAGFLGVFYSAPPIKFCYWGMGELVIGVIFGPLLMAGVWWASAGSFDPWILSVSVPVGLLVINILYTHSMIDREGDAASDKLTLAGLLSKSWLKLSASFVFNFAPFVIYLVAVLMGTLHPLYLVVLVALPRPMWLFWSLVRFEQGKDIDAELEKPRKMLGNMGDWQAYRKAGLDWFLIRWLTARNTVSAFCFLTIVVHVVLLFVR